MSIPSAVSSSIQRDLQIDRYSFESVAGVEYSLTTILDSLDDSAITLYDADMTTLASDDDGGKGLASSISFLAETTGTKYIDVTGVNSFGTYSLNVGFANIDDHGDSANDATPIKLSEPMSGFVRSPSDHEWFSFEAQAGTAYRVTLESLSDSAAALTLLVDDGDTRRLEASSQGQREQLVFLAANTTKHYIRVGPHEGQGFGDFSIHVDIPVGDVNFDGVFDSSDLIALFQKNKFEDGIAANADWLSGDWNGDDEFDSGDLVYAFSVGHYSS